uniref:AlNc14C1382G12921 protein n=1 Tax=Albugo laibachii Nc14 TaxID=890382 RepID=F0X2P3_9STRA|nr:AlNc14C1382G12921 [Albugo laibachii Nc14]|eukprot:CCA28167.1 AlNc14C1382G12921 [Albugo laibachii Nc14]
MGDVLRYKATHVMLTFWSKGLLFLFAKSTTLHVKNAYLINWGLLEWKRC